MKKKFTRGYSSIGEKKYRLVLSSVHMVYRLVNSTYNTRELLLRLTRLVCQLIRASSSCVYLLDSSAKRVSSIASFNNKINFWFDKKKDMKQIPDEEKAVTQGYAIVRNRVIGLPLVADDNIGAIFIRRKKNEPRFNDFDKELLAVIAEQAVTAIKNLQLYDSQQKVILDSIQSIGKLLEKRKPESMPRPPVFFKIIKALAERLHLGETEIASLRYASILHDAGSMDVPFEILSKKSRLTSEEFKIVMDHPAKRVDFIRPVGFLKPVLPIILYHHERYDGTGYPAGLKKEQIPMSARIMSVVDAFQAMVQERPYKKRMTVAEAAAELKLNSGTQFDPHVIDTFFVLYKQKKIRKYLSLLRK